jgi:hypothetical protein
MEPENRHRAQRVKNYALLFILLGVMAMFYTITIVRIGGAGS